MYASIPLKPHCEPNQPASFPLFRPQLVQGGRPDGYWIEAFPFRSDSNKLPNIIGYGLGTYDMKSDIQMFVNPYANNHKHSGWTPVSLAKLDFPVAMHYADITKNGFNDVIITDRYGSSMDDIWPESKNGGRVSWLENPGTDKGEWTMRTIGYSPGMHRLKAGHFTRSDRVQVVAVPIVVASKDVTTPADIIIFTAPDDPKSAEEWYRDVIGHRHLVHEVAIVPASETSGEMKFDQIILAGRDGVDCMWYDGRQWATAVVGAGLEQQQNDPYWGAGSAAVGRIGDDYAGYICSAEAFHGNTVSVYAKPADAAHGIVRPKWERHVLDIFGPLNGKHTGSIHQVVCADIDGDGDDEFLVAMMGADPPDFLRTGVWCYKLVDKATMKFAKTKLSSISAGRIATANFHSTGKEVDIATISYSVPGYFESPNPSINVLLSTGILAERLDEEVMLRVVRSGSTRFTTEMEFLDVSGKKLTFVVLPPHTQLAVKKGVSGVKVMAGTLSWSDAIGKHDRVMAMRPFGADSMIVTADHVESGEEGATFMLLKPSSSSGTPPFSTMSELLAHNIFPPYAPDDVRAMQFPWVRCADRPWAHGRFKGLEFFNLIGFHVHFADDSAAKLAHVQLWTAGIGVSAGFHNHVEASFCEIHACIANGTGKGGMRWTKTGVSDADFNPDEPDLAKTDLIVVPDMHEHGPLWRTLPDGHPKLRMNDTIDYPWHAWLAGPGDPNPQKFDVWVAFEFPSFETFSTPLPPHVLQPDKYLIHLANDHARSLALQGQNATDGTPVVATMDRSAPQPWIVSAVPGTDMYEIAHARTGSLIAARWPPVQNQRVVGTHSPAAMGLTSRWAVSKNTHGGISFRLAEAPGQSALFLSVSSIKEQGNVAVPVVVQGDTLELVAWSLVPAN